MRSIFAKILVWAAGTVALSAAGFMLTTWWLSASHPAPRDMMNRLMTLQLLILRDSYRDGGPERLRRELRRIDAVFEAEHHLVDPDGRDLLDGRDWSGELRYAGVFPWPPGPHGGRMLVATPPDGTEPRLLVAVPARFRPGEFAPYYLWLLPVVAGLGYALSAHLARPLRTLHRAVERFGHGELSARMNSARRDEIGELSRAFDAMAGRIETLLVAERRLLQDVSHELRSPLARLTLAVRLARSAGDREAALDRIKRDVDRLSALTEELLQLTTAEGDPQARRDAEVRLDGLARELVNDCALEAAERGCRVELKDDGPVTVVGDPKLLHRAAENVLRNAIRHAPAGSAVEVTLARDHGAAALTVRDHGPGVPAGSEEAIFAPFFRVDDARSRDRGGVGLGLAIARRAVVLHGGTVAARNAEPGLAVTIRLPLR